MFFKKRPLNTPPEWMIVGLGNPGPEYRGTRHNIGFEVIDSLGTKHKIKVNVGRQRALVGQGQVQGISVLLAKPLTFMNASGQSVAALARHYGLKPNRILIIADDMAMVVGRVRLKPKGSAGGHNGHKSIIEALGSNDYPRLKIGIGSPEEESIEHVLSKFLPDERPVIEKAVREAVTACEQVIADGVERAMSSVNAPGLAHD
jgi:PTH1 family peptidyl-tRNA hydrolase